MTMEELRKKVDNYIEQQRLLGLKEWEIVMSLAKHNFSNTQINQILKIKNAATYMTKIKTKGSREVLKREKKVYFKGCALVTIPSMIEAIVNLVGKPINSLGYTGRKRRTFK